MKNTSSKRLVELAGIKHHNEEETQTDIISETKLRNIIRKEIREMLQNMDASDYDETRKIIANSNKKKNALKDSNTTTVVGFLGHGFR